MRNASNIVRAEKDIPRPATLATTTTAAKTAAATRARGEARVACLSREPLVDEKGLGGEAREGVYVGHDGAVARQAGFVTARIFGNSAGGSEESKEERENEVCYHFDGGECVIDEGAVRRLNAKPSDIYSVHVAPRARSGHGWSVWTLP
jgi:hypothetical protein